ncbi:MAG: prepilin-type N-terminal cleavage/methylation domain-containing protein [Candidatus Riflebacteria bacterium]|nr:prepilin-type N-terminal cleavage/methylation domain-containing protein [Candidatus Riflebacteria bacterium]
MFSNKKFIKGATLIEVVIAIFILACAFLPVLRVVDYGSVSTAKIGHYAKATRLAQELIEECKHVPFKVYQKTYSDLGQGQSFDIHPQFYKETQANIEKFITDSKDSLKDFECKATLRANKNDLDQIVEVWFEVEISWYDIGKISDQKGEKRSIKIGNAYFNSEVL